VKICVLIYLDEDFEILKNDHKDKAKKKAARLRQEIMKDAAWCRSVALQNWLGYPSGT
jgi:hypothetical protein